MLVHRLEVAVVVQQFVAVLDAEGADDQVHGLAAADAERSESAAVSCSHDYKPVVRQGDNFKPSQDTFE